MRRWQSPESPLFPLTRSLADLVWEGYRLNSKGRKDRQIPLVDEGVKVLRNYLRYRATELILDDNTLFLAKNGTSLNVSSVKAIVAKYVKKAGIRKRVSVHTLRHTFGAHKADKHMSIATLRTI